MLRGKYLQGALYILAILFFQSCTRNTIEFGANPQNSYTNIVFTDTVGTSLSTVIVDSFTTGGATSFLVGRYKDPYLGTISATPFFQMTIPTTVTTIAPSEQYDSLIFIFKLSQYYYGDTTRSQTVYINELAQPIVYGYNGKLYNTSNVPVKSTPLGVKTMRFTPTGNDSIVIRLNDAKGQELFAKLREQSMDVTNPSNFLNYFKGISISTGVNDTSAVYGLQFNTANMVMRVYYHSTIPFPVSRYIDFTSTANSYAFNQLLVNRAGTGLATGITYNGQTEISASQTNNTAFMQSGTGTFLKITFPSLRSIISSGNKVVKLLSAELVLRPVYSSFDNNKYKLPSQLYLAATDETNTVGIQLVDSTGAPLFAKPVVDDLYGENNYYRFNITSYINQLLITPGSEDKGVFVILNSSTALDVSRMIINNSLNGTRSSQLLLHLVVINQ
jgi:hypothetical protein